MLFHFLPEMTEEKKKNLSGYLMTQLRLIMIMNNTNYMRHRATWVEAISQHHNLTNALQCDNPSLSCHLAIITTLKQCKSGIPLGNTSLHNIHLCVIVFLMYVKSNIRIMFSRPSLKPPSLNNLLVGNLSHRNRKERTSISSKNIFNVSRHSMSATDPDADSPYCITFPAWLTLLYPTGARECR